MPQNLSIGKSSVNLSIGKLRYGSHGRTKEVEVESDDPRSRKRTRGGRDRVLAAAADLFESRTLAGTSLQMIADRLGVSKPAIYHHFRSREDIVTTLMEPVITDTQAALARLAPMSADERRDEARRFYADFVITHRRVINMVFFDRGALPDEINATVDELVDGVAGALAGSDDAAAVDIGMVLVYGTAALVTRHTTSDDDTLRAAVTGVLDVADPAEQVGPAART